MVASERLGFEPIEVVTSDDILRVAPDCVLVTHEYSPKLTPFPTIGLNWSPPAFFADDPVRQRAVLSLDGHLCGSQKIAEWLRDFVTGQGKRPVLHDTLMLPSAPDCGPARTLPHHLAIMYAGTHWDGSRHGAVFRGLDGRVPLHLYGAPEAWQGRGESYRGVLPFDGTSVIEAIRSAGIALCLHKSVHREANCPSMRIFEAAAAGALIITDDFDFPRQWLRDSVLYVDADLPPPMITEQILDHVAWVNRNRDAAKRLAVRSNELFRRSLTLESMLSTLPEFVERVRGVRGMVPVAPGMTSKPRPTVEYVIRVGSRPAHVVECALESLAQQTHPSLAVTLMKFHPVPGLDEVIERYRARFEWVREFIVANNGNRATCWWAGLRAVKADLFGFLDDDDTLFPNHVSSIVDILEKKPELGLVYTGLIRIEDEPGHYFTPPHFNGPDGKVIEERRELFALERETFAAFTPIRNVIGHNAWICRRACLNEEVLVDPHIPWAEDVFFLAMMADRTRFGFTATATACWHWRSTSKDNWTLSHPPEDYDTSFARWRGKLQNMAYPAHNGIGPPVRWYDVDEALARDLS